MQQEKPHHASTVGIEMKLDYVLRRVRRIRCLVIVERVVSTCELEYDMEAKEARNKSVHIYIRIIFHLLYYDSLDSNVRRHLRNGLRCQN